MAHFLTKHLFKARYIFILFLSCSIINIIGEGLNEKTLIFFSKPLLLFLLLLFFIKNTWSNSYSKVTKWMTFALITANIGDILLLFAGRANGEEHLFLAGLGAFLITHIAYANVFHLLTPTSPFKFPIPLITVMLIFWAGFNYLFSESLTGILQAAVAIYSAVILIMVYFTWRLNTEKKIVPTQWVLGGALLFLLSDSLIGLNKFGQDIVVLPMVGVLIMLTYLIGQALIVLGVIQIVRNEV